MKSQIQAACSFCGAEKHSTKYAGGEWHGSRDTIFCCSSCAIKVLPALIADSVHISPKPTNGHVCRELERHLKLIEGAFWKAAVWRIGGSKE